MVQFIVEEYFMTRSDHEIRRLNTRMIYTAGILMDMAENDTVTLREIKDTCGLLVKQLAGWKVREGA